MPRETREIRNVHHVRQTYLVFMTDQTRLRPPIHIEAAGHSHWDRDVCLIKRNNENFSMELVQEGEMRVVQDGREYVVGPDMIFVHRLGASIEYGVGRTGFARKVYALLAGEMVEPFVAALGIGGIDVYRPAHPRRMERMLASAETLLARPGLHDPVEAGALAVRLLLEMASDCRASTYPAALHSGMDLMSRRMAGKLTLRELAEAAGVSVPSLYRLFETHFGEPPLRYFMRMKMNHAATIMRATPVSVKQMADRLGFRRPDHFCRVFRRFVGSSPGSFRR